MTDDDVPTDASAAGDALVDVADLAADLAELRDLVADLSDAFAALLQKEEQRERPSRWSWRHADAPTAAALWSELIEFVDWLVVRYELTSEHSTVPPCWYRHPVAVEELTAVMGAWQAAYHGADSPRDDLIAWHDRSLWPCLDRLETRASWRSCIDSKQHPPPTLRAWRHDAHMTPFLAADLDAREILGEEPAQNAMAGLP